jgi:hypothetical protein
VSELARRGLQPRIVDNGFPTFDVAPDTPAITPDMVVRVPVGGGV